MIDKLSMIRKGYQAVVKAATADKPEQRDFLLRHPNLGVFEQRMLKEIFIAELNPRLRMDAVKIAELITAGSQIACQCFIAAKVKDMTTPAELKRLEQEAGRMQDTQNFLDDMAKEAMSKAITKGMYVGEKDRPATTGEDTGAVGHSSGDGAELQSSQ